MDLEFEIENQLIERKDHNKVVNKSRNYLHARFNFTTTEWNDELKFALFRNEKGNTYCQKLGTGINCECVVPAEVLRGNFFTVGVYGGDLITSNSSKVLLINSIYTNNISSSQEYKKDVFITLFEKLSGKFEEAAYEDGELIFYNILDNGTRDIVQRVDLHVEDDISENIKLSFTQLSNAIMANGL